MPQEPVLLDGPAVAAALGIKPGVVRIWAVRGKLQRRGRDHRGRTTYDLAQAFDVQRQLHQRRQRRAEAPAGG